MAHVKELGLKQDVTRGTKIRTEHWVLLRLSLLYHVSTWSNILDAMEIVGEEACCFAR